MSITVRWDNAEQSVIYMEVTAAWTWAEYGDALATAHAFMDATPCQHVDVIIDIQQSKLFPSNILSRFSAQTHSLHAKSGMKIMVGANPFATALFNVMRRLNQSAMQRIALVDTLEEARALLRAQADVPAEDAPRGA